MREHRIWSFPALAVMALTVAYAAQETDGPVAGLWAAQALEGPVAARVERVIDGDTIEVQAKIWLGQSVMVRVRIAGIDSAELHAHCAQERREAEAARLYLAARLTGKEVLLTHIGYDKYGGRVRANVNDRDGDVAQALLHEGFARPYRGERRGSWCD